MDTPYILFAGTANPALATAVARELEAPLGRCQVERFPDGELSVRLDETVRGREVFVLQPTSPPVNDHLIEMLAFADACRRASANRVTAVVPYLGYARADRRAHSGRVACRPSEYHAGHGAAARRMDGLGDIVAGAPGPCRGSVPEAAASCTGGASSRAPIGSRAGADRWAPT